MLVTDQTIATAPVLLSVYVWLEGLNGPPAPPLEINPDAGLTDSCGPKMNSRSGRQHLRRRQATARR